MGPLMHPSFTHKITHKITHFQENSYIFSML